MKRCRPRPAEHAEVAAAPRTRQPRHLGIEPLLTIGDVAAILGVSKQVVEVPQLRIVDGALWQKAKARQEQLSFKVGRDESGNALNRAHMARWRRC